MAAGYQEYHIPDAASCLSNLCASLLTGLEDKEMEENSAGERKEKQRASKKSDRTAMRQHTCLTVLGVVTSQPRPS